MERVPLPETPVEGRWPMRMRYCEPAVVGKVAVVGAHRPWLRPQRRIWPGAAGQAPL